MATRMVGHVSRNAARHPRVGVIHARVSNTKLATSGGRLVSEAPRVEQASPPAVGQPPPTVLATAGYPSPAEFRKFSDLELWQLFQKSSDERAFAELYQRHKDEIYTYCLRMMSGDRDKANDVFQEVFIRAFERADQFRSGENVAGWLYTIARNMCLNTFRNTHPMERLDEQEFRISTDRSLAPEYDEQQHFLRRKIEEALLQLPLEFREPFMLREFDGFTYREIAAMTGATMGMTKVRIYRAKQRMRELLAPAFSE